MLVGIVVTIVSSLIEFIYLVQNKIQASSLQLGLQRMEPSPKQKVFQKYSGAPEGMAGDKSRSHGSEKGLTYSQTVCF